MLIILFFVTRAPNPITGGRALSIIHLGITTEVCEFICAGIIAFILTKRGGMTTKQKQQLR